MNAENAEVLASIATGEGHAFQLELLELTASELEELALRLGQIETGSSVKDHELRFYSAHLLGESRRMRRWERDERASGRHEDGFVYKNFVVTTRPTRIAAGLIVDIDRYENELDALGREILERPDVRGLDETSRKSVLMHAIERRLGAKKLIAMKADEIMLQSLILGMAIELDNRRIKENPEYASIRENGNPPDEAV